MRERERERERPSLHESPRAEMTSRELRHQMHGLAPRTPSPEMTSGRAPNLRVLQQRVKELEQQRKISNAAQHGIHSKPPSQYSSPCQPPLGSMSAAQRPQQPLEDTNMPVVKPPQPGTPNPKPQTPTPKPGAPQTAHALSWYIHTLSLDISRY